MDYTRVARKITLVLFLSQGLSSAGFIAAFTVNALVAVDLTGRTAMAGVPGALYVLGQACGSLILGFSMERIGRRRTKAMVEMSTPPLGVFEPTRHFADIAAKCLKRQQVFVHVLGFSEPLLLALVFGQGCAFERVNRGRVDKRPRENPPPQPVA